MKNLSLFLLGFLLLSTFGFVGCGGGNAQNQDASTDSVAVAINEFEVLAQYFESADNYIAKAPIEGGFPKFITAEELNGLLGGYIAIIDLRSAKDFASGHIDGAENVVFENLYYYFKEDFDASSFDQVVLVCYSGQTASYGAGILNLMGYKNVVSLKWGMAGWNKKFANKWIENNKDQFGEMVETTFNPMPSNSGLPTLSTGKTEAAQIADESAKLNIEIGFIGARVKPEDFFADPTKYFVFNLDNEELYKLGHIKGAVFYKNTDLTFSSKLNTLPADKPILVVSQNGQHAAYAVAYLRMIGYDAYSLLYGSNGFMTSKLKGAKMNVFTPAEGKNYPVIETEFVEGADGNKGGGGC